MTERNIENAEIAKLQKDTAVLAALVSVISTASEMAFLGQKLIASADRITEITGALAERNGHSVDALFEHLRRQ
jgi:hypothetical protein